MVGASKHHLLRQLPEAHHAEVGDAIKQDDAAAVKDWAAQLVGALLAQRCERQPAVDRVAPSGAVGGETARLTAGSEPTTSSSVACCLSVSTPLSHLATS